MSLQHVRGWGGPVLNGFSIKLRIRVQTASGFTMTTGGSRIMRGTSILVGIKSTPRSAGTGEACIVVWTSRVSRRYTIRHRGNELCNSVLTLLQCDTIGKINIESDRIAFLSRSMARGCCGQVDEFIVRHFMAWGSGGLGLFIM